MPFKRSWGKKSGRRLHSISSVVRPGAPTISASSASYRNTAHGVRIRHSEYIGDLISASTAGAFSLQQYQLNPGLASTFPWLSTIAANFETYEFHRLGFEFRTSSGNTTAGNAALGTVVMCTQYDALDQPFASKYQMENYEGGISAVPSSNLVHYVQHTKSIGYRGSRYVRILPISMLGVQSTYSTYGAVTAQDIRLFDVGITSVATNGIPTASVNLGELWVTYDIQLYTPRITAVNGNTITLTRMSQAFFTGFNTATNGFAVNTTTNMLGLTAGTPAPHPNAQTNKSTNVISDPTTQALRGNLEIYFLNTDLPPSALGATDNTLVLGPSVQSGRYRIKIIIRGLTGTGANPIAAIPADCFTAGTNCGITMNGQPSVSYQFQAGNGNTQQYTMGGAVTQCPKIGQPGEVNWSYEVEFNYNKAIAVAAGIQYPWIVFDSLGGTPLIVPVFSNATTNYALVEVQLLPWA